MVDYKSKRLHLPKMTGFIMSMSSPTVRFSRSETLGIWVPMCLESHAFSCPTLVVLDATERFAPMLPHLITRDSYLKIPDLSSALNLKRNNCGQYKAKTPYSLTFPNLSCGFGWSSKRTSVKSLYACCSISSKIE